MNTVDLLANQTENAYEWTNKLIQSIPAEKWDVIPGQIRTNVTWQTGHLIMSFYFHSIMVIKGHQMDVIQKIPLQEYNRLFTKASPLNTIGKTTPTDLIAQLYFVQNKSLETIRSLQDVELLHELEKTDVPHPIAKNKFDALDWNIKHTMWHCGQLGILKRMVDKRFDFGLQIND
ncbi:DinB family protein [Anditalea andensis]|uniref:DinB-like domain-containing protein n=1 Tax=Anditalea andensis TaxID=1048983 RepID=A0A074KUW7_9BACT|nr:DinB family protein [Anditalea andensis]KEO72679.1 hypothetical protein EL17_18250 [Anditalea andensis]